MFTVHLISIAELHVNIASCSSINQPRLLAGSIPQTINTGLNLNVKLPVVSHVHSAPGHSQKRELSPGQQVVITKIAN